MYYKRTLVIALLFVAPLFSSHLAVADVTIHTIDVVEITKDGDSVVALSSATKTFNINYPKSIGIIEQVKKGDQVEVELGNSDAAQINRVVKVKTQCDSKTRIIALFVGFMIVLAFFSVVSKGRINVFIIGEDNRYSNSKVQVVLWFTALMTVYLATLGLRVAVLGWDYFGGIGITENLLALSGISTLTYGAAKAVTAQKVTAQKADPVTTQKTDPVTAPKPSGTPDIRVDLFKNDVGGFDLGDTQMFFFILLSIAMFIISSFHWLGWLAYDLNVTLPDVDTTLLSSLGLSQGAYLAKKAASELGKG